MNRFLAYTTKPQADDLTERQLKTFRSVIERKVMATGAVKGSAKGRSVREHATGRKSASATKK